MSSSFVHTVHKSQGGANSPLRRNGVARSSASFSVSVALSCHSANMSSLGRTRRLAEGIGDTLGASDGMGRLRRHRILLAAALNGWPLRTIINMPACASRAIGFRLTWCTGKEKRNNLGHGRQRP
jgi:hypothetical protein